MDRGTHAEPRRAGAVHAAVGYVQRLQGGADRLCGDRLASWGSSMLHALAVVPIPEGHPGAVLDAFSDDIRLEFLIFERFVRAVRPERIDTFAEDELHDGARLNCFAPLL